VVEAKAVKESAATEGKAAKELAVAKANESAANKSPESVIEEPAVKDELSPAKAKAQAKRARLEKVVANRKAVEERICAIQSEKKADVSTEATPKDKAAKKTRSRPSIWTSHPFQQQVVQAPIVQRYRCPNSKLPK